MKHSLQLRLSQHLTLTPQLQQSIRLLQLSTIELNQEIEKFLTENPLLEREDDSPNEPLGGMPPPNPGPGEIAQSAPAQSDEPAQSAGDDAISGESGEFTGDEINYGTPRDDDNDEAGSSQLAAEEQSLRAYLVAQLPHVNLSERDQKLVTLLIDSLDDDGYLHQDLDELAALLPPELEVDVDELHVALRHLQNLDPSGIGARTLNECLLLQLDAMPENTPHREQAVDIARNLERPFAEMALPIKVETRTGDTPVSRRQRQRRYPPHVLLTTPEQLALLLSPDDAPFLFSSLKRRAIIGARPSQRCHRRRCCSASRSGRP